MTDTYSSQPQPFPGLLSPDQGDAKTQAMMALGAGLIKAGGPSETKNNFSGVGDAISGALGAYNAKTTQALQNRFLAGQISKQSFDQMMLLHQTLAQYRGAGLPVPPDLQAMADRAGFAPPPSDGSPAPAPQGGAAPAPGSAPIPQSGPPIVRPPGLLSLPGAPDDTAPAAPAPNSPPQGLLSGGSGGPVGSILPGGAQIMGDGTPATAGPPPGLLSPPGPRGPAPGPVSPGPGVASIIRSMPFQDRYALIGGGPIGKIVEGVTQKNLEQTPAGKDARDPAVLRYDNAKEQGKADVKQYSDLHKGLAGAGYTAANSQPYVDAAKGLLNDPGFYSGSGEGLNLGYKRFLAAAGIDPGAALPQEAFRKVMAANILQQVNSLKAEAEAMGQNGGRIFSSQIELMEKAAQNPDNSIAANRYLTEVAARSAARTQKIADMADDYKTTHGALDAGFEKGMREYLTKNPMFTAKELANPSLVGKPDAAPASAPTHFATNPKTGQRMGLVNNQLVPVDAKGTPIPSAGTPR